MEKSREFNRCICCFAEKENKESCPVCGYENGFYGMPGWWLTPGTIIKGTYMVGKALSETEEELTYLGWDLGRECLIEITEYFPKAYVKRDVTVSDKVNCIPGDEEGLETGKQAFFEKARLFYKCVSRVQKLEMDFFVRNGTCYYVREKKL